MSQLQEHLSSLPHACFAGAIEHRTLCLFVGYHLKRASMKGYLCICILSSSVDSETGQPFLRALDSKQHSKHPHKDGDASQYCRGRDPLDRDQINLKPGVYEYVRHQ